MHARHASKCTLYPQAPTLSFGIFVIVRSGRSTRILRMAVRFPMDENSRNEMHTTMKSIQFQPGEKECVRAHGMCACRRVHDDMMH